MRLPTKGISLFLLLISLGLIAGNLFALGSISLYKIQNKEVISPYINTYTCPSFPPIKNSICLQSNKYLKKVILK